MDAKKQWYQSFSDYLIGGKDSGGNVTSGSTFGHIFNRKTNQPARFYPESFEPFVFFLNFCS